MKTSVNFFYQGDLIVKVLCEYKLLISRYSLVIIFPRNSGLQLVIVLKYENLARSCLQGKCINYFEFRILSTEYYSLGQNFICIVHVFLVIRESSPSGGGVCTTPNLCKGLKWLETAIGRFCSKIAALQNNCFSKTEALRKAVLHL